MKIITSQDIAALGLSSRQCVDWVREAFLMKGECQLPPKISVHPRGIDFFTSMPCLLPADEHTFGCKVVSRIKGKNPALSSDMMLFDTLTGELTALVNCDLITALRTAAVATLAIDTFKRPGAGIISMMGMGVMGRHTLKTLLDTWQDGPVAIRILRYKDQAERAIDEAGDRADVTFEMADSVSELVDGADVVVSCITQADGLIVDSPGLFKPGALVVPVHTRGFQNLDTVFDKVFADDRGHVAGFMYFDRFRSFGEIGDVLAGKIPGRETPAERIISYNIGLGLHDVLFAHRILKILINNTGKNNKERVIEI